MYLSFTLSLSLTHTHTHTLPLSPSSSSSSDDDNECVLKEVTNRKSQPNTSYKKVLYHLNV